MQGSPFRVDVAPGLTDASRCELVGEARAGGLARVPLACEIVTRDSEGSLTRRGGDIFLVSIEGGGHPSHTCTENGAHPF